MKLRKAAGIAIALITGVSGYLSGQIVTANPAEPTPVVQTTPSVTPTTTHVPRTGGEPVPSGGVMRQEDFPCQEDEVLGYHPRFGTDHVGCIHISEFPANW